MASTGDSYDPQKPHFNQGMLQNSGFFPTLGSQENPINIGGRSNQTTPCDNQRSLWSKFNWSNLADHMVGDLRHLPQALNTGNPGFSGDYQDSFLVGNENNSMDFDGKLDFSTDINVFCAKEPGFTLMHIKSLLLPIDHTVFITHPQVNHVFHSPVDIEEFNNPTWPALYHNALHQALAAKLTNSVPENQTPSFNLTYGLININEDLPSGAHTRAITRCDLGTTGSSPWIEFKLRDFINGVAITKECTRVERTLFQHSEGRELMEAYWATEPLLSYDRKLTYGQLSIKKNLPFSY